MIGQVSRRRNDRIHRRFIIPSTWIIRCVACRTIEKPTLRPDRASGLKSHYLRWSVGRSVNQQWFVPTVSVVFLIFRALLLCRIDVCITVSEPSPESKPEDEPPVITHCSLELPESTVSITVTDASPESSDTAQSPPITFVAGTNTTNSAHQKRAAFRRGSEAITIHHALVHRESDDDNK